MTVDEARAAHEACESNPDNVPFEECDNPVCVAARTPYNETDDEFDGAGE